MRGVTEFNYIEVEYYPISTRTPHAGSDGIRSPLSHVREISTRTPHAGSDL